MVPKLTNWSNKTLETMTTTLTTESLTTTKTGQLTTHEWLQSNSVGCYWEGEGLPGPPVGVEGSPDRTGDEIPLDTLN